MTKSVFSHTLPMWHNQIWLCGILKPGGHFDTFLLTEHFMWCKVIECVGTMGDVLDLEEVWTDVCHDPGFPSSMLHLV